MTSNGFWIFVMAFTLCAAAAEARQEPKPVPSGEVVHLFGPNSVMGNILPVAPGTPGPAAGSNPEITAPQASGTTTPAVPDQRDPSVHDILHQLFVVGDPNAKPGFPAGRTTERP